MFKQLVDFGFNRSTKQAVGFYIAYLVLLMIVAGVLAGILTSSSDLTTAEEGFQAGVAIGQKFVPIAVLALAALVLKGKNLFTNFGYILLSVLAAFLSIFGGGLLGLIPIAYITTRKKIVK